ncbi:MAG: hypothetical protein ACM31L_13535 [Actinomycetota bacterium]
MTLLPMGALPSAAALLPRHPPWALNGPAGVAGSRPMEQMAEELLVAVSPSLGYWVLLLLAGW